eukprot:m.41399 g.41399  ORF g.41399 m.41399 type:complete len:421 (+) comp6125_c0_seq2:74-1336(+)
MASLRHTVHCPPPRRCLLILVTLMSITISMCDSMSHRRITVTDSQTAPMSVAASPPPPGTPSAAHVCARWRQDRADRSPVSWRGAFNCPTGAVNTSDAGAVTTTDKQRMIAQLNLYRWLVGLTEPVQSGGMFPAGMRNPGYNQYKSAWAGRSRDDAAQACSYMLGSNAGIHFGHDDYCYVMGKIGTFQPDCGGVAPNNPAYKCHCYTYDNDEATFLGGIAAFDGVVAMDAYIVDYGSISSVPLGHRRLMFAQHLGPVGVGSTGPAPETDRSYSCLAMVDPEQPPQPRRWIAFPGPGYIPFNAMYPYGTGSNCSLTNCELRNNDYMGWHFQSTELDLTGASVAIHVKTADGTWTSPGPQRKPLLAPAVALAGVGAGNTLVFGPETTERGCVWTSTAGKTYRVTITMADASAISYEFGVESC